MCIVPSEKKPNPSRNSNTLQRFFFQCGINGLVGFDWLSLSFSRTSHTPSASKSTATAGKKKEFASSYYSEVPQGTLLSPLLFRTAHKNTKQLWPFLISVFLFSFVLSHGNFETTGARSGEANRICENNVITQMSGVCQPPVAPRDTVPQLTSKATIPTKITLKFATTVQAVLVSAIS